MTNKPGADTRKILQDRTLKSRADDQQPRSWAFLRAMFFACVLVIAGCANNYDAPIEQKPALPSPLRPSTSAPARSSASALAERERPIPAVHIVASGDKLLTIAWRYGLDVRDLIRWNQITNPDLIVVGRSLRLRPLRPPPVQQTHAPGARPTAPESTAPLVSAGADREPTPAASAAPRSSQVLSSSLPPPSGAAANPTSTTASAPKLVGGLVTSSAANPSNDDKTNALDASATAKEGVSWMWPTQGKISAADIGAAGKGIDIRGARGQAVKAAAAGAVVYSGSGLRGYGELIIIKHNDTFLSAYAHNEVRLVQENRRVAAGESIARMGNSDTSDVMLHFEIRRNGKSIDPLQYLPKR